MVNLGTLGALVLCIAMSACSSAASNPDLDFAAVFGAQELPPLVRQLNGDRPPSELTSSDSRLDRYTIQLRVVHGRDMELTDGVPVVTLVDGAPRAVEELRVSPDRVYVHGRSTWLRIGAGGPSTGCWCA